MKLNFKVADDLYTGIRRLEPILGFECGDGVVVSGVAGERIGVALSDGEASIYYRTKVQFFRGLGILVEALRRGEAELDITEDASFDTVATMIDASRCAVPRAGTVFALLDRLALMGYNMMMLYTEDTVELEGRPFFGYMRGRYSCEELRSIDDYAFEYGIEVIPCIECYAHMERYLIWPEASAIKDTPTILLAREEKTFEFVEQLISTVTSCFRSRRVHIGMDEADDMGRGKFLGKHGYVPPFEIFNEYMERLSAILKKYGLRPMMWSDMYFRVHSKSGGDYYDPDTEIPESTVSRIPDDMDMVFWYYGETTDESTDDFMLEKHKALGRGVIEATGAWSWCGHFPEHNMMMLTNKRSVEACRRHGVREVMLTIWGNDNNECELFSNLLGLSYFAELCYDASPSEEKLRARFEACTDGDYDLFYKLCYFHNDFENSKEFAHRDFRFLGKQLFWQDPLMGLYEPALLKKPMSEHYAIAAETFSGEHDGRWAYLYEHAHAIMEYLRIKTYIAERLATAYKAGDKETLSEMARVHLPALIEKCDVMHRSHKAAWMRNNKAFGWQNMDVKYGGMKARCETAIEMIEGYLDGRLAEIEELVPERLPLHYHAYITYQRSFTVNYK